MSQPAASTSSRTASAATAAAFAQRTRNPHPAKAHRRTPAYAPLNIQIHRQNAAIERCAEDGNLRQALMLARDLRTKLQHTSTGPDANTYNALAKNFAVHGLASEAMRLVQDARAAGIEPDVDMWNEVLRV